MVSIVIPAFNQGIYLEDTIKSVLNQTKSPGEVIIVNDGSTDNTRAVALKYTGSHKGRDGNYFKLKLINQTNRGLASARNTGIMNATGNYILPLDSDDLLLKDCIEEINKAIRQTNADIIGLSFREFGIRNTEIILMDNPTIEEFKYGNRLGYCSAIKRSVLLECGGYSARMVWGYEDYALWFDLLTRDKKIAIVKKIVWLYRTKPVSMITESMKHHVELMQQIAKDFPNVYPEYVEVKTPLPQ